MSSNSLGYEVIDHTADLGIVVKGADLKDLFIRAAYAMTDLMVRGHAGTRGEERELVATGEDLPDLMVRWLSEILYLFAGEHLVVRAIEIGSISPIRLQSTLSVTPFKKGYYRIIREIKAVTYHQISVERARNGWEARIIFDI